MSYSTHCLKEKRENFLMKTFPVLKLLLNDTRTLPTEIHHGDNNEICHSANNPGKPTR